MNNFIYLVIGLFSLTLLTTVQADKRNDTCTPAEDAGTSSCKGKSETRWYFNGKFGKCMNFTYSGCAGNKNNFKTKEECRAECCPQKKLDHNCTVISISRDDIGCPNLEIACGENATQALKHKPKPNPKKPKTDGSTQKTTPQTTHTKNVNSTTKPPTKKPKVQRIF